MKDLGFKYSTKSGNSFQQTPGAFKHKYEEFAESDQKLKCTNSL